MIESTQAQDKQHLEDNIINDLFWLVESKDNVQWIWNSFKDK